MERGKDFSAYIPGLAAFSFFLVCLSLPSFYYNFDGVACAVAIELGDWRFLLHGNHLLYGALGRVAYLGAAALGYKGQALFILTFLNALLSAASLAVFMRLLKRLGVLERTALAAAAGLAFSYAFWFYSVEAQVYPLGLLLVLATADAALAAAPCPITVGLLHAMALTGHVTHLCLAPAVFYRLWTASAPKDRWTTVLRYVGAGAAGTLAAYALAALVLRPNGWEGTKLWLIGTAAVGPQRAFVWNGTFQPHLWVEGLVDALWAQTGSLGLRIAPGKLFPLELAGTLGLTAWAFQRAPRGPRAFFGLWLAGYALFFSTWEPYNINYHLADLAALWALCAVAASTKPVRPWNGRLLIANAAAVGLNSLILGVGPLSSPEANPRLNEMVFVREMTRPESWVATLGGEAMVYVPYFARRKPWTLPRHEGEPGEKDEIYALSEVIDDAAWRGKLAERWDWQEIRQGDLRLYKLRRKI